MIAYLVSKLKLFWIRNNTIFREHWATGILYTKNKLYSYYHTWSLNTIFIFKNSKLKILT